jgi:hypothetical protein
MKQKIIFYDVVNKFLKHIQNKLDLSSSVSIFKFIYLFGLLLLIVSESLGRLNDELQ